MAVGAELGRAGVGVHGAHLALHRYMPAFGVALRDPDLAELQVDDIALFEIDDLVGDAGQRHRVGRQKVVARPLAGADSQHQRRAFARTDHALRLVAAEHSDRIGAAQPRRGVLDRLEQVAVVVVVDQVGDDLGVGLAREVIALGAQLGAQLVVVLDDAVVDERDAARRCLAGAGPMRKMRVRVVDCRRAMGGPTGVGDAGAALHFVGRDAGFELRDTRRAARPTQLATLVNRHAARIVATVFEALQAFDQNRNDVAGADCADDAAHGETLEVG